jgi:hypothetical protein
MVGVAPRISVPYGGCPNATIWPCLDFLHNTHPAELIVVIFLHHVHYIPHHHIALHLPPGPAQQLLLEYQMYPFLPKLFYTLLSMLLPPSEAGGFLEPDSRHFHRSPTELEV